MISVNKSIRFRCYFILSILLLVLNENVIKAQQSPKIMFDESIKGDYLAFRVVNKENGKPLSFCNIVIKKKRFGTISDEKGQFLLSSAFLNPNETIIVSHIGYETRVINGAELTNINVIELSEKALVLDEIVVANKKSNSVEGLMESIIDSIEANYIDNSFSMATTLYRKDNSGEHNPVNKISSLIFYENGYNNTNNDQIFLIDRYCYAEYDNVKENWAYKAYTNDVMYADRLGFFLRDFILRRKRNFLNKKNLSHYSFDIQSESDNEIVIRFKANKPKFGIVPFAYLKSFSGRIYVDSESYAITQINAYAVMDEKKINRRNTVKFESVAKLEITSYYKKDANQKYYWAGSSFMDNILLKSQIVSENDIFGYGELKEKYDTIYLEEKTLCK